MPLWMNEKVNWQVKCQYMKLIAVHFKRFGTVYADEFDILTFSSVKIGLATVL